MRQLWISLIAGTALSAGGTAFAGGLPGSNTASTATAGSTAQAAAAPATTVAETTVAETTASATTTGAAGQTASTEMASTDSNSQTASGGVDNGDVQTGSFIAIEDDPLIIDASSVVDGDGVGSMQVQWQIATDGTDWSNLSGEIRQSFTPRERHVGKLLRVQLSYVDGQGNLETILSPPSSPVQNVNDKPNGAPQLVGAAREEDALVVDTSMISDDDGLGNFSIIWQRSSTKTEWQAFPETNGEVLQLSQRHVGFSYRAVVSYEDGHGTKELLVASPSETVQNVDDPVQGEE